MSKLMDRLLADNGIKPRTSYRPFEVRAILGVSERTFWTMVTSYEEDEKGRPLKPAALNSYTLRRERRVTHRELEDFLMRNATYERLNTMSPNQLDLFDE